MPTLHLMCGLPGSGKTTLAKQLEREIPALRLCPDEWMARILRDGRNEPAREAIERIQMDIADSVLRLGRDVILESGFWSRQERDEARERASRAGARIRLHFLDVPIEELLRRTDLRNQSLRNHSLPDDSFPVTKEELREWAQLFEPPAADELT